MPNTARAAYPTGRCPSAHARQAETRIYQDERVLRDSPVIARLVKRSPNELLCRTVFFYYYLSSALYSITLPFRSSFVWFSLPLLVPFLVLCFLVLLYFGVFPAVLPLQHVLRLSPICIKFPSSLVSRSFQHGAFGCLLHHRLLDRRPFPIPCVSGPMLQPY